MHPLKKLWQQLKQQTWFNFLVVLLSHFEADECREKAASLTYTTALSIVPVLTVFLVILSSVPTLNKAKDHITQWIYGNMLPQTSLKITEYLNDFAEKSSNLTLIGVLILFVTTMLMLAKVEQVFNQIWKVKPENKGLLNLTMNGFYRYWLLITLVPVFLAITFIFSSTISSISFLNKQIAGYAINWSLWLEILSVLLTLAGLTVIYWLVPAAKVPLKHAAIAGIFVGIVFELLKSLFGIIMINFTSYQLVYGAFAALPLLLLWIYFSWCLILFGVEISYTLGVYNNRSNNETEPPQHIVMSVLAVLNLLYVEQKSGNAVKESLLKTQLHYQHTEKWQHIRALLLQHNLILITDTDEVALKKSLYHVSLWQLLCLFDSKINALNAGVNKNHLHTDELKDIKRKDIANSDKASSDKASSEKFSTEIASKDIASIKTSLAQIFDTQ